MTTQSLPWYREPWPWILISITGLGVVAGSTLAFIGITNPPEIVRGDYAQLGRGLTDTNVRTAQARALGLSGSLRLDDQHVVLSLAATDTTTLPAELMVVFQHPASSELDRTALLRQTAGGDYAGQLDIAPHERALIVVSDLPQSWWLSGRFNGGLAGPAALAPKRL